MATKKAKRRGGRKKGQNASAFIRKQPASMSPKEIMEAGKKAGLKFSINLVYAVRSRAGSAKPKGKRRVRRAAAGSNASEAQFRRLVLDLGLGRAKALVDEVERGMKQLIAGG